MRTQANQARDFGGQTSSNSQATRTPAIIRTARLQIVVKGFGGTRESVEALVAQAGGFLDHMTVTGDTSEARTLRGALRVPSDRMADTLARLRGMGQVTEDTQGSEDVTDQVVDLDARLASARATEQRLTELLRNRTGRLSDVLEVERELTRVRLDIERLVAEKTNIGRRVSYATIDLTISEERKVEPRRSAVARDAPPHRRLGRPRVRTRQRRRHRPVRAARRSDASLLGSNRRRSPGWLLRHGFASGCRIRDRDRRSEVGDQG